MTIRGKSGGTRCASMLKKPVTILFIISLGVNTYLMGKWLLMDQWYEADSEERIILSEMVQKTVSSEDYKKIAEQEDVIAIDRGVDKNKGGVFPYYMMVSVRTDKQTYLFSCSDEQCTKMESAGTTYSVYQDENPRLPFKH